MRKFPWFFAAMLAFFLPTAGARADTEVTFVGGSSISGNISAFSGVNFQSIDAGVKNSPLFGVRVGTYGFPIGFEGSLIFSPAGLTGGILNNLLKGKANFVYTEANLLLIVLPGPVAPFVTGGVGLHNVDFSVADLTLFNKTKVGYNFGGGVKVNASKLALRVDLRDHVTTVGLDDVGLGLIAQIFGLSSTSARIHNVEFSVGVGIRF